MGTLLLVHAHPDDESISTGGVMMKAKKDGHRVVLVTATRGEAGEIHNMDADSTRPRLGEVRTEEMRRAAEILGVDRTEFLDYRDSGILVARLLGHVLHERLHQGARNRRVVELGRTPAFLGQEIQRRIRDVVRLDVVRMAVRSVRVVRDDHVGALLAQDRSDPVDQLVERHVGHAAVRVPQELVPVGSPAERDPRSTVLALADPAEVGPRGEGRVRDHAALAARGVHQREPEARLVGVKRDGAGARERVIVRVGDDGDQAAAHLSRSRPPRAGRGPP
jgi:hypothetical protein